MVVLLPNVETQLMGVFTNQVGKAWDTTALAAMWDIQENLLEVSTKAQALAVPAPETSTTKAKEERAIPLAVSPGQPPKPTCANKETEISVEDNPEQRQVCKTTHMTLKDNPLERQLDY